MEVPEGEKFESIDNADLAAPNSMRLVEQLPPKIRNLRDKKRRSILSAGLSRFIKATLRGLKRSKCNETVVVRNVALVRVNAARTLYSIIRLSFAENLEINQYSVFKTSSDPIVKILGLTFSSNFLLRSLG